MQTGSLRYSRPEVCVTMCAPYARIAGGAQASCSVGNGRQEAALHSEFVFELLFSAGFRKQKPEASKRRLRPPRRGGPTVVRT